MARILWKGASQLDGAPIVALVTGLERASDNQKTGDMVQVYILREDMSPLDAVKRGHDTSVCGHCPMRSPQGMKGRACYVNVGQAPEGVWRHFKRNDRLSNWCKPSDFKGRKVRWGAYGDAAMLLPGTVGKVQLFASGHTGYTHQWRYSWAQWAKGFLMASCENQEQANKALGEGWGVFRSGLPDGSDIGYATLCANERTGTTCSECMACDGRRQEIYIPSHGWGANNIPALRLLRKAKT